MALKDYMVHVADRGAVNQDLPIYSTYYQQLEVIEGDPELTYGSPEYFALAEAQALVDAGKITLVGEMWAQSSELKAMADLPENEGGLFACAIAIGGVKPSGNYTENGESKPYPHIMVVDAPSPSLASEKAKTDFKLFQGISVSDPVSTPFITKPDINGA